MDQQKSIPAISDLSGALPKERLAFHLDMLFETVSELSQLTDPVEVMERFLLMSMGALGTGQGLLALLDCRAGDLREVRRGLPAVPEVHLRSILQGLCEKLGEAGDVLSRQAMVVAINAHPSKPGLPEDLSVLLEWYLDDQRIGVLGYGPKINGSVYDHHDKDFLLRLASAFMDALAAAYVHETTRGLNAVLQSRNIELEQALRASQEIQASLDRRYFHFKAICDTTRELSANLQVTSLLSAFLLSVMGTVSAQQGFIILWNRKEQTIEEVVRGYSADTSPSLDVHRLDGVFRNLLHPPFVPTQGEKHSLILDGEALQALELPGAPEVGAAFLVDEGMYGVVGLGNCLARSEDGLAEQELLSALLQGFLVSLGNALAFETIEKLNEDLLQTNTELRQTLEELRQSRQTISLLEAAGQRINALLHSETLRIKRVSLFDCLALAAISLVLALVFNASSPGGISLLPEVWGRPSPDFIDVPWAGLKHESQGALFLDARPVEFFNQQRISGAENLPLNLFDFVYAMRFAMLDPDQDIIVYGRNISRRYDELVAAKLTERGMTNVRVLEGGLRQWLRNGLPVEP